MRVIEAGLAGAALSGIPSTLVTLLEGGDVLEAGRAAGKIVLPREERTAVLLAAAVPVHLALSLGWAAVIAALPRRTPLTGLAAGLAGRSRAAAGPGAGGPLRASGGRARAAGGRPWGLGGGWGAGGGRPTPAPRGGGRRGGGGGGGGGLAGRSGPFAKIFC